MLIKKMNANSLKEKTISGLTWSMVERFSTQGIQFLISIVIARLLNPSDFGIIGMINIFIAISYSIIDSGFSAALIQKKDRTQVDFSTIFFFNVSISILLYLLILIFSPLIAAFYNNKQLILLTKIVGLNIIILSFSIIQTTIYSIYLDFRTQAKASIISIFFSGILGILLAYYGYGVWSLVWQTITKNFLNVILLWFYSKWIPSLCFSKKSLFSLFSYGYNLLIAGLLFTIFENIYLIIIGKYFNSKDLGYYVKAKNFSNLPSSVISAIFLRVTFPIFSSIQDEKSKLLLIYKKILRFTIFITFPLIILLAIISQPLISILLTEKWLKTAYFLKFLCLVMIWFPLNEINVNILKVKAKTNIVLKLAIFRIFVTVLMLLITLPYGLDILIIGQVLSAFIIFFIIYLYTCRIININPKNQIIDILHFFLVTISIGLITNLINTTTLPNLLKIFSEVFLYISLYLFYSNFFFKSELKEMILVLKYRLSKLIGN